ncbi:peptidase P60 [Alsobacter metallidurans]|uniref:Peptidase P60 n=1 Tax=Alsobacter metallidurans TaxID=340221 RepID=A0A917I4Q9_9HYPH|nr:NlpC/P60 family protein [Alsobacter metallidurans]GGH08607.1 peptidase P60 [Alsobacter metallidurans]
MTQLDRRITPVRPDLAAEKLRGQVDAPRFAEPRPMRLVTPAAWIRRSPTPDAPADTQALFGEHFDAYEITDEGWAWGQLATDGYVGWMSAEALAPAAEPTHRVAVLRTFVYPGPSIKITPSEAISIGSRIVVERLQGAFAVTASGGFIFADHLAPLDAAEDDFVAVAERFVGVPYLWGGRTSLGLDCSGLVQLSLAASGRKCPRDSDMQEAGLGEPVADWEAEPLRRGDFVFWKGHIGVMQDAERLLHANGTHMLVVSEPFAEARARILEKTGADVTSVRRLV